MRRRGYVSTDRFASPSRRLLMRQHDRENGTASVGATEPVVALEWILYATVR